MSKPPKTIALRIGVVVRDDGDFAVLGGRAEHDSPETLRDELLGITGWPEDATFRFLTYLQVIALPDATPLVAEQPPMPRLAV